MQLQIGPSRPHNLTIFYHLASGSRLIQITCYRIQKPGGTERLWCGAPLHCPSPRSARSYANPNHFKRAEPYPAAVQENANLKTRANFSRGFGWTAKTRTPPIKANPLILLVGVWPASPFQTLFLEQTNLHSDTSRGNKKGKRRGERKHA